MKPYSVLMAVYQKEKAEYLKESIVSMISQTVPADEIVIVCDGPLTDALDQVIKEMINDCPGLFRIVRLKRQGGLGNALKTGVDACRNEWIARMDSDDISVSDRCERQLCAQEQTGQILWEDLQRSLPKIYQTVKQAGLYRKQTEKSGGLPGGEIRLTIRPLCFANLPC